MGSLRLVLRPLAGEDLTLWETSGDQGNIWNRQFQVVENSTVFGDYNVVFVATVEKNHGGDIAIDDVVFTYNCRYIFHHKYGAIIDSF